jgi:hypothetical protein
MGGWLAAGGMCPAYVLRVFHDDDDDDDDDVMPPLLATVI